MTRGLTDVATVEFQSPDGRSIVVFADQVFAVTSMATTGKTTILGPANAVVFVEGSVKDARDKLVAALTHAPKDKGE